MVGDIPAFEVVHTAFPGRANWYARITLASGIVVHVGPWNSHWAAERCAHLRRRAWMSRHTDIGNGDTCPLFPHHGNMAVIQGTQPPKQWCANQEHDGRGDKVPKSRAIWPLHGFEETVIAYTARLDRAIREATPATLPDLDVEVLL